MALYDAVADLPLRIEDVSLERRERETSSGFTRVTTTISLSGDGETGKGEDVTYETADHDALLDAGPPDLAGAEPRSAGNASGPHPRAGKYTIAEFSDHVGDLDLFPDGPSRADFRYYRRWGFESAALDLALRQAGTDLAGALGRSYTVGRTSASNCAGPPRRNMYEQVRPTVYDPVRFIVSMRLGEPPSADRVERFLDLDPDLEFKLDPTTGWTPELIDHLAETGAVRALDLKGRYEGTVVDQAADPALYERVVEGFPEAIIEDPALTEGTRPILAGHERRIAWDAPIHGVGSIEDLPFEPAWLNIKPSRFGSVESLFETIEYCIERDIGLYGGGQFELGVGRGQIQALASMFYPDAANDVAPGGYNDPEVVEGLPSSPLDPPADPVGFRW